MRPGAPHVCCGCQKPIRSGEPHIHVGLDEWAEMHGKEQFGLDDLLTFPFCEPCTVDADKGWELTAHEIAEAAT